MVIGIAGKYATGKSTVARMLEERGFLHLDVDTFGNDAREHRRNEILARFGTTERRELGRIVFADPQALHDLESIVHPEMVRMVEQGIDSHRDVDVVINAAILFRMGLDGLCDHVIIVTAPYLLRLLRALRRDNRPFREVVARLRSQAPGTNEPQSSGRNADIIRVRNAFGVRHLRRSVERILARVRE